MGSIWREPLVHFALLGTALFAGHAAWQASVSKADYTINVSTDELERQAIIFAGENRRQPTDDDLKALLFAYVEEQVLMREAERLGLGEDDTIIRRRLAQKMRFMIEDVDGPSAPTDAELRAWFDNNKSKFLNAERRSFTHIYLSPQSRGEAIHDEAKALLADVNSLKDPDGWKRLGDPFMMKREYEPITATDGVRLFGKEFTADLFKLRNDSSVWQGPIASAFGLHIVRVNAVQPASMPSFDAVKQSVLAAWLDETRRGDNQTRLKELIEKYDVKVEGLDP